MGYYTRLVHEDTEYPLLLLGHEESRWQATISPTTGGEISSLQWQGHELLYRANDFAAPPAGGWRGRAPLLWPAVGRNFTPAHLLRVRAGQGDPTQGSYLHQGKEWPMPIHGFAFRRRWELVEWGIHQEAWARLRLRADHWTRELYPFEFTLEVEHRLIAPAAVRSTYTVHSGSDGLICSFGNHITLALPGGPDAFAATRLTTSAPHPILLGLHAPGLMGAAASARPDLAAGTATLADPSLLDTVIAGFAELESPATPPTTAASAPSAPAAAAPAAAAPAALDADASDPLALANACAGMPPATTPTDASTAVSAERMPAWIEVHHPQLPPIRIAQSGKRLLLDPDSPHHFRLDHAGRLVGEGANSLEVPPDLYPSLLLGLDPQYYYFVLWGNRDQGFFCPEPWYGGPNSLNLRQGVVLLQSGEAASWTMDVRLLVS